MELAKKEHVPPYIVFADKTLTEMSTYLPDDKEKMLKVSGVGNHKYEKYGEAFEEVIREYCRSIGLIRMILWGEDESMLSYA